MELNIIFASLGKEATHLVYLTWDRTVMLGCATV